MNTLLQPAGPQHLLRGPGHSPMSPRVPGASVPSGFPKLSSGGLRDVLVLSPLWKHVTDTEAQRSPSRPKAAGE